MNSGCSYLITTILLLDVFAIDTGFKKGRGNRQGGGKSQFEFPARMIPKTKQDDPIEKSFGTFSSQKSRPVKRPSIPLAYRAKEVKKVLKLLINPLHQLKPNT